MQSIGDLTAKQASLAFQTAFKPDDARKTWPDVARLVNPLIMRRRTATAAIATRHYQQMRLAHGFGTLTGIPRPEELTPEELHKITEPSGLGMFLKQISEGATWADAMKSAAFSVSQSAASAVLDGARQAVIGAVKIDPESSSWERIARPGTCDFCKAQSGIHSQDVTAFPVHNSCRCFAAPVFGGGR